jgi:hypothetical protein
VNACRDPTDYILLWICLSVGVAVADSIFKWREMIDTLATVFWMGFALLMMYLTILERHT